MEIKPKKTANVIARIPSSRSEFRETWQSRENNNVIESARLPRPDSAKAASGLAMTVVLELFYVLSSALVIFIIMELIKPNIVQAYISLNLVLILWLVSGIVLLIVKRKS